MKMKKSIILLTALIVGGCFGKKESADKYPLDLPIRVVNYEVVAERPDVSQREFAGQITTEVLSDLSFRVSGTMQARYVDLGDYVAKGQLLAELDPSDYQIQYNQSYAQMERSKANFINAQSTFKRDEILYLENSISLSQYQSAQASFEASKSELAAAKSSVAYQQKQLGYTKLYAPADGTISQVNKQVGEIVSPETPVFVLNVSGDLEIIFNISESGISQIKIGDTVPFVVDALGDQTYNAVITNIGTVSTGFGNTYPVKAKIINPVPNMRVGMTITSTLDLPSTMLDAGKIMIPPEVIMLNADNKKYVFVIENIEDGKGVIKQNYIETGKVESSGVEVLNGLKTGEYLVTDGYNQINAGEKVELKGKEETK
jgi:RND family efflux transporter MFP subunit